MLLAELLESLLGLIATDEVVHVSDVGEDTASGSESEPLRHLATAVARAAGLAAGRRLLVRLHGSTPFVETVAVPSNVTIAGPATIRAAAAGPALTVENAARVVLRDLEVVGRTPFTGLGGAIRVATAQDVRLERCVLRDSRAGRGGGIAVLDSSGVVLDHCTLRDNRAGGPVTPVDIFPPTLSLPGGDGHGGGLFARDSDVRLAGCDVQGNRAVYAGGGVAVVNAARPAALVTLDDCEVTRNQTSHQPLGRLGAEWTSIAPAATDDMGDPVREQFRDTLLDEETELDVLSLAHGLNYESGFGGGIAARGTRDGPVLRNCRIGVTRAGVAAPNIARRGGGVHLYTGANAHLADCVIAFNAASGDGGGVGGDFFDPFMPNELPRFGIAPVPMIPRLPIVVERCEFRGNQSIEDGGGMYMTGGARPAITGGVFVDNRAGEHGGGLRATYASRVTATGVRFESNRANVFTVEADGDNEGGGALSARNSDVHLEGCAFLRNRTLGFAGGAIYYRSSFEGGASATGLQSDVHGMFDEIQETAFDFRRRFLRIVDCTADDNRALGPRGAGGFLYALRSPVVDGGEVHGGQEAMWVSVEGARTAIGACRSEHDRGGTVGTRKRGTVVIELSGRVTAGVPDDRVSIAPDVPAGAIARSVPEPDGRALVVMPDAAQANDVRRRDWDGVPFVRGPAPALTSLDKAVVPAAGGVAVRATGTGFGAGMAVRVGDAEAAVTAETGTTVDFTVPAGAPGVHDVTVRLASGAQSRLAGALKLVLPPQITYLSKLRAAAGETLTMRGRGLPAGTRVHFLFAAGETEATVSQQRDDELEITVPAPPAGQSRAAVRATSPTGEQFTRPPDKTFVYVL